MSDDSKNQQGARILKRKMPVSMRIKRHAAQLHAQSPYKTFELDKGCGEDAVRTSYYKLIKSYHPDVWGLLDNSADKVLAQDLFFAFKGQFESLLALEKYETARTSKIQAAYVDPTGQGHESSVGLVFDSDGGFGLDDDSEVSPTSSVDRQAQLQGLLRRTAQKNLRKTYDTLRSSHVERPPEQERVKRATIEPDARKEHMKRLLQRKETTQSQQPIAPKKPESSKAQKAFNHGYRSYQASSWKHALEAFTYAFELEPDNGLYKTFYAYTMFLNDASCKLTALQMLREVADSKHRQAMSDAFLFIGYIYRTIEAKADRAMAYFEKSLELNPHNTDAQNAQRLEARRAKKVRGRPSSLSGLFNKKP